MKLTKNQETIDFVNGKHDEMKNWKCRVRYDKLLDDMEANLIDTASGILNKINGADRAPAYLYGWGDNGMITQTLQMTRPESSVKSVIPREPFAFGKIMIATSVLGSNLPNGTFTASDKLYARTNYELWKNSWEQEGGNGKATLTNFYQSVIGSGWGAFRTFPNKITIPRKGKQPKIIFDGITRECLNPRRTFLGVNTNNRDYWSRGECLYEYDIPYEVFKRAIKGAKIDETGLDMVTDATKGKCVTYKYYESLLDNRTCITCGTYCLYDGELLNSDGYNTIQWANFMVRDTEDPYGVGLYEQIRGNAAIADELNSLTYEEVVAEIAPLLFARTTGGGGEMKYKRGSNVVNPLNAASQIEVVKTSGNIEASSRFADQQKLNAESNTGVNNILAGQSGESTLGATVILKEAALNRLVIPRNSVLRAIEADAHAVLALIRQNYSEEDIYAFEDKEEFEDFIATNPDYFTGNHAEDTGPDGKLRYFASMSVAVPKSFEYDAETDDIKELTSPSNNYISEMYGDMADHGISRQKLNISIDPNSMLLPSEEMKKQRLLEILPVIKQAWLEIMQVVKVDPVAAKGLSKMLIYMLEEQKINPYDVFPKDIFDSLQRGDLAAPPAPPEMVDEAYGNMPTDNNLPQINNPMTNSIDSSMGQAANIENVAGRGLQE